VAKCGPRFKLVEGAEDVSMHWAVRPDRHRRSKDRGEPCVLDRRYNVASASLNASSSPSSIE
jgi:hypothetical protein